MLASSCWEETQAGKSATGAKNPCESQIRSASTCKHRERMRMGVAGIIINNYYLVGGLNPSEKYEFVNWDDDIPKSYGKI